MKSRPEDRPFPPVEAADEEPPPRVLVVDDDAGTRLALKAALQSPDREVVLASSGEEALRIAEAEDVAVVLLDVRMPGLNGYETASRLRAARRTRHVPVILVSGAEPRAVELGVGYSLGAVDYILKPLNVEILRSKVSVFIELWRKERRVRAEAEEALRAGRALSSAVLEGTSDCIYAKDLEGRYLLFNAASSRMAGRPSGEVVGRTDEEVFGPEAGARLREHDLRVIRTGRPDRRIETMPSPDGPLTFDTLKSPLRDHRGRIRGVIGISRDITGERAEEERQRCLSEASARLASTLDYEETVRTALRIAVPRLGEAACLRLREADGTWRRLTLVEGQADPRRVAEVRGVEPGVERTHRAQRLEPVPEEERAAFEDPEQAALLRRAAAGAGLRVPLAVRGHTLGILTLLSSRRAAGVELPFAEEMVHRIALALDNARLYREARQEVEERRRVDDRFQRALQATNEVLYEWEPGTERRSLSGAVREVFGEPPEAAEKAGPLGRVHPDDLVRVRESLDAALAGKVSLWSAEYRLRRADGCAATVCDRAVIVRDEKGAATRLAGSLLDITGRRAAEEQLRLLNEDLERRVRERTRELEIFAHALSHDLRAPLRAMASLSQLLMEDYAGRVLDEAGQDYARRISDSARRLDVLTRDLLAYVRMDAVEPRREAVDLGDLLEEVVLLTGDEARRRDATVSVVEPLPMVRADPVLLRQAVSNLVVNGLKFSAPGRPPRVVIRAEREDERVRLRVEDDGIGIAREDLGRLFVMFERLHAGDGLPGSGLGLAIVKKFTERMGGRIGVQSEPGRGSVFWIELPEAPAGRRSR